MAAFLAYSVDLPICMVITWCPSMTVGGDPVGSGATVCGIVIYQVFV